MTCRYTIFGDPVYLSANLLYNSFIRERQELKSWLFLCIFVLVFQGIGLMFFM